MDEERPDEAEPLGGSTQPFAAWSAEQMIGAADGGLTRLADLGVEVQSDNRLLRARDTIERCERLNVQLGPGDPRMERTLAEANKTVFEIQLALRGLANPTKAVRKKLRIMLRGLDVPMDMQNDHARDEQAEFVTAALFCAAGYTVDVAEPDLIIRKGARQLGVAVKRVKSDRQFQARVRKANDQLRDSKLQGLIVVNPELMLARAYYQDRTADLSRLLFDRTIEWMRYAEYADPTSPLLGVIGLATSFRWVAGGNGRQFAVKLHFVPRLVTHEDMGGLSYVHGAVKALTGAILRTLTSQHL